MRVLVDSNLIIAYLLTPSGDHFMAFLLDVVADGQVTLLLPEALLKEIVQTAQRKPHLRQRINPAWLAQFIAVLQSVGEEIPLITEPIPALTRDPKDDYLLAYAFVGQADYLITGDKDLLDLPPLSGLTIVTSAQFREIVRQTL